MKELTEVTEQAFVTVTSGGASDVDEGVYEVVLTAISDRKTVMAQRGPKAGQEIDLIDWTFAIVGGPHNDKELTSSTSTASGPKSKMFSYLTALLGGRPPAVNTPFKKSDLVGRMALATVSIDEGGWPRVANLGALPASLLAAHVARTTGAPTQGTPVRGNGAPQNAAPLNLQPTQVAVPPTQPAAPDDLPF